MTTRAIAYPASGRILAAVLMVISRGSLLVFVALLFFLDSWLSTPVRLGNPLRLLRAFSLFCLVPACVLWVLERACEVAIRFEQGRLVLLRRAQRIEIDCVAIECVEPWAVPLPAGGVSLRLPSGRRFHYGLQVTDPVAFIEALADGGAPEPVRHASQSPAALYARSRSRISSRWYHRVLAFVVFALVPAVPLFRLHQWITYGGTFGEYYVYGWNAYLLGFAVYWGSACVNLVLYAAVLRALAEPIVWTVAHLAPARTERVRRVVEVADRILYYGGVPVLLMRIFLS